MDIYKWNDGLKINHDKIDDDHKLIIEKARELSEFMMKGKGKEKIVETVDFLNRYVKTHFREEEQLQEKWGYPKRTEHKASHKYFIDQLDMLSEKIKQEPNSTKNCIELNKLISGWFVNHIKRMDTDLTAFNKEHQTKY